MKKMILVHLDLYNKNVIQRIMDKYNMDQMAAARAFLTSETHEMLENAFDDINSLMTTGKHIDYSKGL